MMLLAAAILFATAAIADADRLEPCPARDGVLLSRASGLTLLRLDGMHGEEPVPNDINCGVPPRGSTMSIPLLHCNAWGAVENGGFAAATAAYSGDPENGLWMMAADGRRERLTERPWMWALLGRGRIVVITDCRTSECDVEAFVRDFDSRARRDLFAGVPEPTTPPDVVLPQRPYRRNAKIVATSFGSDPSRRAVLVHVWKDAGFGANVILPTKRPFHIDEFLVVPSSGEPWRVERNLIALPWGTTILLHDSGTILLVAGRHIERISSPAQ